MGIDTSTVFAPIAEAGALSMPDIGGIPLAPGTKVFVRLRETGRVVTAHLLRIDHTFDVAFTEPVDGTIEHKGIPAADVHVAPLESPYKKLEEVFHKFASALRDNENAFRRLESRIDQQAWPALMCFIAGFATSTFGFLIYLALR
jgi:hypothetical protein